MPLVAADMKTKMRSRIHEGLKRVFSSAAGQGTNYTPEADAQWQLMADAISDIAMDIVTELQTNAEVAPGIAVVTNGSPTTQAGTTVSPGKIL